MMRYDELIRAQQTSALLLFFSRGSVASFFALFVCLNIFVFLLLLLLFILDDPDGILAGQSMYFE